jgi:hypothetical protein
MPTATETPQRTLTFAKPPVRNVAAWRALLGLDRGHTNPWHVSTEELRHTATSNRSVRPMGANTDVWNRVVRVGGDSAALVDARRDLAAAENAAAVDDFIDWLDSEDFGSDPQGIRREAWR